MAHPIETRQAVRSAYVHDRLPLEAAADRAGVAYQSARTWKARARQDGDDWDKARSANLLASGGLGDITAQLLEDFTLLFQAVVEDITQGDYDGLKKAEALSRLSDAYTKTMKAAAGGDPKIAKLSVALETLQMLAEYIKEHHPEALGLYSQILEPFGARVNQAFG